MPQDEFEDARKRLLKSLMDRVRNDRFPSSTMLDTIEELLHEDEVSEYTDILLGHIEDDTYPSTPMIARLRDLSVG
jgi:hypothetical protein